MGETREEQQRLREEWYAEIRRVVRETRSFKKAAAILGCNHITLYGIYHRQGWPLPPREKGVRVDLCLAWDMRKEGKTYREIGEYFGISNSYINTLMTEQEVACQRPHVPTTRAQQFFEMKKEGKTYKEIGECFGVTRQAVQLTIKYWYGADVGERYSRRRKGFDVYAMVQLRELGWNNVQVADLFETDPSCVWALIKNVWGENIKTVTNKPYTWDIYEAWSLFEEGWTYKELAEKYGKHMMTIAKGLQKIRRT